MYNKVSTDKYFAFFVKKFISKQYIYYIRYRYYLSIDIDIDIYEIYMNAFIYIFI